MPQISLPPEITCDVVRCLDRAEDKETLFACNLTCKAFLSTSRKTIFKTVELFWPPSPPSFDSTFLDLIRASPELGSSVSKFLTFPNSVGTTYVGATLAVGLSKVLDLKIRYMNWNNTDADSRTALVSGFKTIKHLELTFPKFAFSHEETEFISSFPLLTHLHIQGDPSQLFAPPRQLDAVSVSANQASVLATNAIKPAPAIIFCVYNNICTVRKHRLSP
jgi:hypothetical protein